MQDYQIKKINIQDKNYPPLLKKIKDPPKTFYLKGELSLEEKFFAVVGTRYCTDYGKELAFSISRKLAENNITIVSGLARGIDTFAHKGALQAGGKTVAVLGTGLSDRVFYPKENLKLSKEILKMKGALISEFDLETPALKYNFPKRNRIISGLSLGVLVVEAGFRSGALITAEFAFSQKKPVFAIPGSVFWKKSKGCNFLLKRGAHLVESAEDILDFFKIKPKNNILKLENNNEKSIILNVIKEKAKTVDEIIKETKLPTSKVLSLLTILESEGRVKSLTNDKFLILK